MDEVEELFLEGGHLDQDGFGAAGVGGDVVEAEEGAGGFADLGEGDAGAGEQALLFELDGVDLVITDRTQKK